MPSNQDPGWVAGSPRRLRTFGVLNIVFGSILLLVGAGYAAWFLLAPSFTNQMRFRVQQEQGAVKVRLDTEIADYKSKEAAAKSEQEKQHWKDTRATLESAPPPNLVQFDDLSRWDVMSDHRLALYYWIEVISGILLNLFMVVAGVGLLFMADWARRLSLGVAWVKILRWVAILIFMLTLIIPITSERMHRALTRMEAQTGSVRSPFNSTEVVRYVAIFSAVTSVFSAIVAVIYPGLSIWFLTRPQARAACLPARQQPPSEGEFSEWP
jgi:hypothetical protein